MVAEVVTIKPPEAPEHELSRLIVDELRVYVSPNELRLFVRHNWAQLSRLTHAISGK